MKWFQSHRKLTLAATGATVAVGGLLWGYRYQQTPVVGQAASQSSPVSQPIPAITSSAAPRKKPLALPNAGLPSTAKPAPTTLPKTGAKPSLTKAQEEINRRAKESFRASTASIDTVVEMQVAIAEGVPGLTLRSLSAAVLTDKDGKVLHQLPTQTTYNAQPESGAVLLGGWRLPPVVWLDPGKAGLFQLGDRVYKGQLLLVSDAGRLWAVNTVNLRQYLYSVVGSEVSPSWNLEALKAQTVAARSYALTYYFNPVSPLFHLGATEYYQVYSGIQTEADRTRQAVDATAGEYVSYKGGVVESLYAASDDIVAEAFQGKGMSQLGAKGLADQGYGYQQILKYYYPGTAVGRIKPYHE